MNQNRMKSWAMWMAVLAQVLVILQITGALDISQIEIIDQVATAVLQVLVLFGILNNPEAKDHF